MSASRKRKAAEVTAAAVEELGNSALAKHLLSEFAWGILSAQQIQKIAALALEDCRARRVRELDRLAAAGGGGTHPGNVYRDIMIAASRDSALAQPFKVTLGTDGPEEGQSMLLPHVLFADIWAQYPETFQKCINPGDAHVLAFWQTAKRLPQYEDGAGGLEGVDLRTVVPLLLHGDETPVTGKGCLGLKPQPETLHILDLKP
jgi:hypothetical protein